MTQPLRLLKSGLQNLRLVAPDDPGVQMTAMIFMPLRIPQGRPPPHAAARAAIFESDQRAASPELHNLIRKARPTAWRAGLVTVSAACHAAPAVSVQTRSAKLSDL